MSKLRFGLLGLGRFGKHYARILQEIPEVELVAVGVKNPDSFKKKEIKLPHNVIKTTDASEVINNVDCVIIATPASTHFEIAKKAVLAGKHVLLEKPMVTSLDEAKKLKEIVDKSKATFMVGYQYSYNDYFIKLKKELDTLGRIYYLTGQHLYSGPVRDDIGCFMDAGVHKLAMIQQLFNPKKIVKVIGKSIDVGNEGRDDFTSVTIEFDNKLIASLTTSWFYPEKVRKLTLIGEKGMAIFDDNADVDKLKFFYQKYSDAFVSEPVIPSVNATEPLKNQIKYFINCVKTGGKPLTDIENSYLITEWMDQIYTTLKSLKQPHQ